MAKYIIDIPDEKTYSYVNDEHTFLRMPISVGENESKSISAPTLLRIKPYTEPDEDESYGVNRYKAIGLAFLKWLGNDTGDMLKSADDVYRFLDKNCYNKDAVEQEVWEFASILMNMHPDVAEDIYWSMNGGKGIGVATEMTYQEAKARYEEWKQKEEIEVGDELKDDENIRAVVLDILDADYESYEVITENGIVDEWQKGIVIKTGRHFSEVEELLKKMRGEE